MACELKTEKYISVVEKLIKLDAAEYANFDNVAKFVLNSSLSDEQKKMSLHNISHIFNSLYALDNSAYELGKAHEVMANVSVIENTEEYLKLTASTFEVKEPVSPSLSNLNAAIDKLQNSTSLMPDDLKKDIVPLIAKYMSSTQFDSDEERKESFDKIKMHVVTVINSFGEDTGYKRILLKTFYDAVEGLKSSSTYINLDEIADKVNLDNTLVVLKTGEIFEAVTVGTQIKVISEDGSLADVNPEDIAYSKVARNTNSYFSNAQGQHRFHEGTLSSAFTITAVEDSEQDSINAALNKMTSSKGLRITKVPLSHIGAERIERVHDLAREEEGMSPLLNRKHETFETPAQQKKLASKKNSQVLTVARPTYLEQGHAFMGEIVETGQRFYIYSFDNYAFVDGENSTSLVDFTKPAHKELVKELSVKQTSAGEVSLTDTDLANIENAVKYYNDFKEEAKYATDEDVSDLFFKYYDLQHQRGTRVVTPLSQEVKNDKTLTTPVTVVTMDEKTGEKTEELYNLPVYIYKKYNEQTGELEYVHKTVLAQNQRIKHTREDGVAVEVSESIYARDVLKVNDSVYQEFFGEEDVQLKNAKEKGVVSKRQTSNFLITFKDNGKLGYRIVEPKRIMENLEYFPQFVVMLAEALNLESKFTAVKEFDKNGMAFPVRKGLAVSLAINPNRNGKLFLEFRPYGPQFANIITKDNKGKFGIEINVPFIKVAAESLFGEKSEIYKNVISDYPALAGLNSAEFFEKAFDLMETSDAKDSLIKLRNKADASMSLFSKDIAKAFTDNMESMGEGTDFMKVLREQYTFSDGVFRPEELLFTRNSKNELIPRIQFAFNNVTGEPKFNRAYKNLNVISTTSPRRFAIVPRENIEVAPETSEIIETTYPVKKEPAESNLDNTIDNPIKSTDDLIINVQGTTNKGFEDIETNDKSIPKVDESKFLNLTNTRINNSGYAIDNNVLRVRVNGADMFGRAGGGVQVSVKLPSNFNPGLFSGLLENIEFEGMTTPEATAKVVDEIKNAIFYSILNAKPSNAASQSSTSTNVPTTSAEDLGFDVEDEEMNFSMEEGTTPATASDIISETSWLKENLPQFDIMIAYLEEVLDLTKVDGTVLGAYKDKVIYLDKMLAAKGTLYHEAFHGVFRNIFTSEKRRELLDSVKSAAKNKARFTEAALKEYARKINKPYSKEQMEDIVAEEILAEGFQNYMLGKNKPTGLLKQLFEALKKLINMFNKKSSEIDAVYSNIRTGHYKNAVIKSEMFKGQTAFELIPGLKRFSLNDAGTVTRAQTALTPSEQSGLTNFIVGEIAATASTDTFDEQFERAVDKVLAEVFDIGNLIRQNPSAEAAIIAKYGPRYANFRFVLGARAKGLPVFDVNYTEKEELNGVVEKNTVVGPDNNPLDNTLGNYSKELLKKAVKQKFELLDSIKVEKEENEDDENEIDEDLIGKALDESKGVLDTQAEEVADETKDSADFDKSFNEHNRVDSYVSHLRRYISAIRSDISDKELGIKVPQMIDGDAIFTTLMKITADVNPSDIIETLKVAADIMIEDGFAEQGHQIKALYNKIVKDSVIVDGKPTKNKQIYNILVEVLHGVELDYAMFNVTTPGKTDDEFSEQAPFSFTLKDKVVDDDTRKKRDNIISALLIGFKANASKPEYKAAALELAKKCALIGKTESSILAGVYGQSVEAERLTKELADLMAVIDLKLPKTLIKASLLAIEEKDLKQTLELTPDLDSFYKMNDKFISEKQYLEKEFFLDLAVVLNNMYNKSGVNPSFVNYMDDQNKSLGRFNSILKNASVFALKYDPTEIPSVIRNAEGKPIYRYTKYTPLATVTQQLRREGLAATLQKDEFYEDYLLDFMLDNPMFADLLKDGKQDTPEAKKAKLLLDNIKIALFGGVQQIQGKHFTEGKSFANVDERSLYILNILSFLNRTTLKDSTGTTIDTYMRSYHQVEATQTNFLMTAMHESLIGFNYVVAGSKNKYERQGKATYKGRLAIVKDLESIVKQEFNRIKRESNKDTIKRRVDAYKAGDSSHNLIRKFNAILSKDGKDVITDAKDLRAYDFNILDTFFKDKANETLKTKLIDSAKLQESFSDLPEDTYNELLNALNQHAESEFNNHLQKLEQLDLIENKEVPQPEGFAPVEFYTSELLSKKLRRAGTDGQDLSEVYPKVPGQPKQNNDVTEALIFDHFFNYWRNTLHVNQIFDGDIAMSVNNAQDYVKRQKKLAASGSNMKEGTHKVAYLNTIVGYVNRKFPQYGPYYSKQELEKDTLIPDDVKKYLLEEYGGKDHMFEIFDGQSISSLMHQMDMYDTLGRLDETAKKLLIAKHYRNLTEKETKYLKGLKIVNNSKKTITATRFQYHKLSESYIDRNDVSYLNVPEDQVEKTYEVLDRLYSNIYENRKSLQEARDNGNTSEEKEFEELIKQDVKEIHTYYKPLPHRKHMHRLLNSMEYHIIDQVMDTTANKNATKLPVDFFADKTGEPGYLNLELSSINVQNSGKYMQVETSGVKDKSKVSVQKKVLIAADIEKIRELIRIDLAKGGLPYTESEKKAVELLADTLAGYQKSLKDGAESRLSYLQNVMREGGHFDIAKVFNLIQDNLIAQNSPSSMIKMFDVVNGKPVLSPNLTVLRNTLEYYFFSQYNKNVTDEKASGFKNFHESSFGYEVVVDENNNVIPTEIVRQNPEAFEGNKTRNLGVTIEVDEKTGVKTYFIEAIFPMPNFKNEKQKLFYKEKLTKMFGVRIPTEDKRSMIAIKAVDFVDASKGNAVIVPHLVHILSGSDFDIDSLFGQMISYYEDSKGNFHVYGEYSGYENEQEGKFIEFVHYMKKKSEFKNIIKQAVKDLKASTEIDEESGKKFLNGIYKETKEMLDYMGYDTTNLLSKPSKILFDKAIEIQALIDVFSKYNLPISFEQFSENPMFAGMVADKFQNKNLQDSIDIMSNEAVFKRLFINQQSSVQVFKDILDSFGIDLDVITKKGNLFSIDSVVASKIENAMNKDGIGITAVLNKFLAVASEHGLELQNPVWKYTDIKTNKPHEYATYGGMNDKQERTIALIGNILGMFADGAKEPIGTALQMNTVNAATVLSMVGLGVDPAFAFALNFIPEIKKAAADVQQAQFAITDKQDVNRLFLATEVGNQIDKLLKDNPSAYQNLVNAGLLVLDPFKMSRGLDIDKDALALSFAPKHVDLGRLKDGMLTIDEIGFDVDNITGDAHLNDTEKKIVLMALYMEQAQQTSVNQSVASLTNFFKTLQPSFKATDKILETLNRLLDEDDRLIFTDASVRRMFSENSVFQTAKKTFFDLDEESKRIFLERTPTFAPLVKAFGSYFDEVRDVAEVITGYIGVSQFVNETPGSRKSTNKKLQDLIDEDDANLAKSFKADYWFLNDLPEELEKFKEMYPENKFLKLLRTAFADTETAKVAKSDGSVVSVKQRYIKLIGKTKITGAFATEFVDDVNFLFNYASPEAKMFIKKLFYHELARTGLHSKKGSFLKYLPQELQIPLSDRIQKFVDRINNKEKIENIIQDTGSASPEQFAKALIEQMNYAVVLKEGKSKVKQFPMIDLSEDSYILNFADDIEGAKAKADHVESAILKVFGGTGKLPVGFKATLKKFTAEMFGDKFTMDFDRDGLSTSEEMIGEHFASRLGIIQDGETKLRTFPLMFRVNGVFYALKALDDIKLETRFIESMDTMAMGNKAVYEKVIGVPNTEVLSPLGFSREELTRYELISNRKLIIGNEEAVTKANKTESFVEDADFDIPEEDEDTFEQSGSLASLGLAPASTTQPSASVEIKPEDITFKSNKLETFERIEGLEPVKGYSLVIKNQPNVDLFTYKDKIGWQIIDNVSKNKLPLRDTLSGDAGTKNEITEALSNTLNYYSKKEFSKKILEEIGFNFVTTQPSTLPTVDDLIGNTEEEDDFDMPEDGEGSGSLASMGFNFNTNLKKETSELPTTNTISTPEKPIEIYSDGSDIKGTGRIGFGAVFVHNGKEYSLSGTEVSEDVATMKRLFPDAKFSNPTMEMLALVKSLENFTGRGEHIVINQDYKGAVNYNGLWNKSEGSAQRDPKPWKSKEAYITYLVNRAEDAIASIEEAGGSVKLTWVKGHSGNIMNEKADQAAKAREEFDTFEDVYKENDNDNTPCQGGAPF